MMKTLFFGSVYCATEQSFLRAYSRDLSEGPTPTQRVVHLLQNIQKELEKEADKDQELYDELVCWCKTNDKEKKEAVKAAEAKIGELESEIEERSGRGGTLKTEIAQLEKEIKKNSEALAQAEEIRRKDQKEFREQQKDSVQAIESMKQAITVLSKQNQGLLQITPEIQESLVSLLHYAGERHRANQVSKDSPEVFLSVGESTSEFVKAVQGKLTQAPLPEEYASRVLSSLVQVEQPAGYKSYNNRSGQIFGILGNMLEEFEKKLADARAEDKKAEEEFLQLETAKKDEIESAEKQRADKKAEDASNGKALSDAKEDLKETRGKYSLDKEFLRNLALQCQSIDKDFENRKINRSDEVAAISEALKILVDDDNREALQKTTFLQVESTASARKAAIHVLSAADIGDWEGIWKAREAPSTPKAQLSTLSLNVSLDKFVKVKAAMDSMVKELKASQEADSKHKDFCTEEFNDNKKDIRDTTYKKEDLDEKIEGFDNHITMLTNEISEANKEIARVQTEIKKASEDRAAQNKEFQTELANQAASKEILQRVLDRLNEFYAKGAQAFVQQTPPKSFGAYKSNNGTTPVLALIQKIIDDSNASVKEATRDEQESQEGFEKFVADSNASVKSLQEQVTSKSEASAQSKAEKESTESDHAFTLSELEKLEKYRADLHGECDFLLKNYDLRQKARTQEREAIAEAKAILSGTKVL